MSEILKMKSVPILNATDFYKYFDILDVIRNREACVRFVLGHFKWSNSINLHHIDMLQKACNPNSSIELTKAADYWNSDGKGLCKNSCNVLSGYDLQNGVVDKIFRKYGKEFSGKEHHILLLLIAGILLGNQTEACLQNISVSEMKAAYMQEPKEYERSLEVENHTNVVNLRLNDSSMKISLPFFAGCFRLPFNPKLQPSSANRLQTWVVQATAKAILELYDVRSNKVVEKRELESGEKLFCLVLNETVVKILPNIVRNGKNTLIRKKDGVYLNEHQNVGIPATASSFAVGADVDFPWMLYVCDGYIKYVNSDGMGHRRNVSEQINVIAEVCIVNGKAVIVRNDGKVWDGVNFVLKG